MKNRLNKLLINFDNFLSLIQQVCSVHRKTKPEHVEIFPKLFRMRKIFDMQQIEKKNRISKCIVWTIYIVSYLVEPPSPVKKFRTENRNTKVEHGQCIDKNI